MNSTLRRSLRSIYRSAPMIPLRSTYLSFVYFNRYYRSRIVKVFSTTFRRPNELSNFTYDLTDDNLNVLAHTVSVVTRKPHAEILGYIREVHGNTKLHKTLYEGLRRKGYASDILVNPFGRRAGWYAFVRALKPRVVVETGVDRGYGSLILCAALLANRAEGAPGYYYGTDIDPTAGWLLGGEFAEVGEILYGDSIESLNALDETVDLFINDSDHSAEYEYREYQTIGPKLSPKAVILGDNSHVTDKLARYSAETGRAFLFFKEVPRDHWYPGAGIGISSPRQS